MEVTEYKGLGLSEILAPLTKGQRAYLSLQVMGLEEEDALNLLKFTKETVRGWLYEEAFKVRREWLLTHPEKFEEQAMVAFVNGMQYGALVVLGNLVEMGKDWEGIKAGDKKYIMQAIGLVSKIGTKPKSGDSYDEWLKRVTIEERGG